MYGVIPYTHQGLRLVAFCQHGQSLAQLLTFAKGLQAMTVATIPFAEARDRQIIDASVAPLDTPPFDREDKEGLAFHHKAILTFKIDGERFGFPIYAPTLALFEDAEFRTQRGLRASKRVTKAWGDYFAKIYPAANVEFETGWLCR